MKTIVPDTGVLIDGRITELLSKEKDSARVVVPQSVVAELEFQANSGKEIGFAGLAELKALSALANEKKIVLEFTGERPSAFEISRARFGEIDSKIRLVARELNAVLYTTDRVQFEVASAEGIQVHYLHPVIAQLKLSLEEFFDSTTLSVHLKEGCKPKAKKGLPGEFELKEIGDKVLLKKEIESFGVEAVEYAKRGKNSFIELDKKGALVLQIRDLRVTYTRPPFSEKQEITVVRPIRKMSLDEYELPQELWTRLQSRAEGIVIAGPPGSGKSTFASALAEFYASSGKIVKTLEQPRDLQLTPDITQYSPLEGSFENTSDILLLVRPDYTIYDEVRKPNDFITFADLRMAGIGMVGVVHASKPIDAIQRFIGKIDLGMIPQVIDTIIFIEKGRVAKVFSLSFEVRVPHGMTEQDLARPVIGVSDVLAGTPEYEIYKFGDETVVFPIPSGVKKKKAVVVDEARIYNILSRFVKDFNYEVSGGKLLLYVSDRDASKVIGKQGKNIAKLEKAIGMRIDVREQ